MFIFPFPRGGACPSATAVSSVSTFSPADSPAHALALTPSSAAAPSSGRPRSSHRCSTFSRRPARPPLAWLLNHGSYGPTWGRARLSARDISRGATFNRAAGPVHPLAPAPVPALRLRQAYTGGLPDPVLHLSPGLRTRARPPRRTTAPGWGNAMPPTGPSPPPPPEPAEAARMVQPLKGGSSLPPGLTPPAARSAHGFATSTRTQIPHVAPSSSAPPRIPLPAGRTTRLGT
jgi:hypothetical protein